MLTRACHATRARGYSLTRACHATRTRGHTPHVHVTLFSLRIIFFSATDLKCSRVSSKFFTVKGRRARATGGQKAELLIADGKGHCEAYGWWIEKQVGRNYMRKQIEDKFERIWKLFLVDLCVRRRVLDG